MKLVLGLRALRLDFDNLRPSSYYGMTHVGTENWSGLPELESLSLDIKCLLSHVGLDWNPYGDLEPSSVMPSWPFFAGDSVLVSLLPSSIRELRIFKGAHGNDIAHLGPALQNWRRLHRSGSRA